MKIEQSAGLCRITIHTDGWPLWPTIAIQQNNGEEIEARVSMAELHDLRYCIDRLLAQLPKGAST